MTNAPISKGMAKWLEDFVGTLAGNRKEKEEIVDINVNTEIEKIAEININDLEKIVWNDETFYVLFDEKIGSATVLNEFGNVVTTINATNIEQVDEILNSKQIVTSSTEDEVGECLEDQLDEANEYLNKLADEDLTMDNQHNTLEQLDVDEDNIKQKLIEMEEKFNLMEQKLIELQSQEYAYQEKTILDDFNDTVQENELQHIEDSAKLVEEQILNEQLVDLTTPEGRVSLKDKLTNEMIEIINTNEEELEEAVDIEDETDLEEINNVPTEMQPIEQVVNEIKDENNEETQEENKLDDFNIEAQNKDEEQDIIKLHSKDEKIFKKAICPVCGDELMKSRLVGIVQGVICNGECKTEYAVNLETEEIFKHK